MQKELPIREQHYHSLGLEKLGVNMRTYNTLVAGGFITVGQTNFLSLKQTLRRAYYEENLVSRNLGPVAIFQLKKAFDLGKTHREELGFVESDYLAMYRAGWIVKGQTKLPELSRRVKSMVNSSSIAPGQTNVEILQAFLGSDFSKRKHPKRNCEAILTKLGISLD